MGFGAFAPLPLRLGGSEVDGLVSPQHARLCADLGAIKRVMPLVVLTFDKSGATVTIEQYYSMEGIGVLYGVGAVSIGTGQTTFTWGKNFTDGYQVVYPVNIRHGRATCHASSVAQYGTVSIDAANVVTVTTRDKDGSATDGRATLRLW